MKTVKKVDKKKTVVALNKTAAKPTTSTSEIRKRLVKKANATAKARAYIGIKEVMASLMTLGEYNAYRGWTIPENEKPETPGYLVTYPDGYVSWCPETQFLTANRSMDNLNFSGAVHMMKKGHKLARAGWNGKGMWVIYVPGNRKVELRPGTPYAAHLGKRKFVEILPHFDMWTVNAEGRRAMLPGWLASQSDIDASDWCVVK